MTLTQLKTALGIAVSIGKLLAPKTETKLDDKAVALVEQLSTNDLILVALLKVLGGDVDPPVAGMEAGDLALLRSVQANPVALDLVRYAVSVCEE